jgi:hypothetical protein
MKRTLSVLVTALACTFVLSSSLLAFDPRVVDPQQDTKQEGKKDKDTKQPKSEPQPQPAPPPQPSPSDGEPAPAPSTTPPSGEPEPRTDNKGDASGSPSGDATKTGGEAKTDGAAQPGEGPAAGTPAPGAKPEAGKTAGNEKDDEPDAEEAKKAAQAPKRFIPTEKSSADNGETFPVDI